MLMRPAASPLLCLLALSGCASPWVSDPADVLETIGSIERLDTEIYTLVPPGAKVEVIAKGFDWCEGPVWVDRDGGYLLFSDIPPNKVLRWQAGAGTSVYLEQSGYLDPIPRPDHVPPDEPGSNGLLLDPRGNLVLCQHGLRQVARMAAPLSRPRPEFLPIATHWEQKRFNSPNDAVFAKNGDLYFTDPPYGLPRKLEDPNKEIPFQGVYRVSPAGEVSLLTRDMTRPNGIALSPDGRTLYVANSDPARPVWMAFPVLADGSIGAGRVFFDASALAKDRAGMPDGLAVDERGNLFATGPGGVLVLAPDGRHLGTILTGKRTSNCTFGDDGKTLYATADDCLVRIRLSTSGL